MLGALGPPNPDEVARYRWWMAKLSARERSELPDRAFAYIDAGGNRRLPIHDEAHVRNALGRFERVKFQDDAARDRARRRLLNAAKRFGIVPVGFIAGQLRSERSARTPDYSTFPTGVVTFLLTDIEGSSMLLNRLGDGYAPVLRDVRLVIRNAVRRFGGLRVDATGDEFLSVFEKPVPAIEAAIDLQLGMAARKWPDWVQVRVRAGVHTGRPALTDSGYVGVAVNTVSRVSDCGHGGQIVVTDKTRAAVADLLPSGVTFRNLGEHRLPGLPQPEALFQIGAKGLLTRFPELRRTDG